LELINQSENSSSLVELAKLQVKQAEMIKRNVQMRDKILEAKEEIGRILLISEYLTISKT
jgi:4-hydroxy-3-methylbut-2-enyl diphosphate reductase IspH